MTDRQTFDAIRALGMACQKNNGEWRIDYKIGDMRRVAGEYGTSYFTDDKQDALETAKVMSVR